MKTKSIIFIIIAVVVVGGLGYWLAIRKAIAPTDQSSTTPPPVVAGDSANWKTYRDEFTGVTVQYPLTFTINQPSSGDFIAPPSYEGINPDTGHNLVFSFDKISGRVSSLDEYNKNFLQPSSTIERPNFAIEYASNTKIKSLKVDGHSAYEYRTKSLSLENDLNKAGNPLLLKEIDSLRAVVFREDIGIIYVADLDIKSNVESVSNIDIASEIPFFEKILSTIKFSQ